MVITSDVSFLLSFTTVNGLVLVPVHGSTTYISSVFASHLGQMIYLSIYCVSTVDDLDDLVYHLPL